MKSAEAVLAARLYLKYALIVAGGCAAIFLSLWAAFWENEVEIAFYSTVLYLGIFFSAISTAFHFGWKHGLTAIVCAVIVALALFNGLNYGLQLAKAHGIQGAWLSAKYATVER
jgi:hypothetical protein